MPIHSDLMRVALLLACTGCAGTSKVAQNYKQTANSRASHLASAVRGSHQLSVPAKKREATSAAPGSVVGVDDVEGVQRNVAGQEADRDSSRQIHLTAFQPEVITTQLESPASVPAAVDPIPDSSGNAAQATDSSSKEISPEVPDDSTSLSKETFPIDLVTVIRLVNDNSPAVGFSRSRVQEAQARAQAADFLWLPNLMAGTAYNRFDGQTQNQHGEVFSVSRSNLFMNGGVGLALDTSEAIYRPLIEQRLAAAEQHRADATSLAAELDAILAYLELSQLHGLIEINAQTLEKGESLLVAAQNAQRAKLDRTPGDVNRIQTEILIRRQERLDLKGKAGAASARLAKLLLLKPSVWLIPQKAEMIPITLVRAELSLDELVATAFQNRPDLAASREFLSAASERVQKAQRGPLLPKLQVVDQGGVFGGGLNADLQNFAGRNSITALMYWELKNLGFGNRFEVQERQAGADQAHFLLAETQARMSSEVVEAAQTASAKYESLNLAEQAVKEATELYRINQEGTFNVVDAKNLFDALRPIQALQVLNQARQNYLAAVLDYTRSQYRLYTALGCPQGLSANFVPAAPESPGPLE